MQIYVCVKHVPDTASNIRILGGPSIDESIKFIMNPYDEYALEQALQVREKAGGSEVIAITVGKEAAAATLRSALAMGADRGILVKMDSYFIDSLETSCLLKQAIDLDGSPDLIFTGKQSVDIEGMQTPFRLAALFDLPVVVDVVAFSMAEGLVTVERESEGDARDVIEMTVPCVVGTARGLNQPRCPTLPDMMKARKKDIKIMQRSDFDIQPSSHTPEIVKLEVVPDRGKGKILQNNPEGMVLELLSLLRDEAKVL